MGYMSDRIGRRKVDCFGAHPGRGGHPALGLLTDHGDDRSRRSVCDAIHGAGRVGSNPRASLGTGARFRAEFPARFRLPVRRTGFRIVIVYIQAALAEHMSYASGRWPLQAPWFFWEAQS